jgi:hypothetical protein
MIWQAYLTSHLQLNWWTEEQNITHKPVTWWDHARASAYMTISGLDAGRITPELKLRLKFYCSWTCCFLLCFLLFFVCLFVILLWVFYFYSYFLSVLSTSHQYLLIPILTPFMLPPSPVLQFIVLLPNYSLCLFLSTLSPCLHLTIPSFPNLSPHYASLLHTHHLLINPL